MSITIDGTTGILNNSSNPILKQTGSVLQVVQGTYSTQQTLTSTSFVSTGITASITPTSATSKILIIYNFSGLTVSTNSLYSTIYRNASNLAGACGFIETASGGGVLYFPNTVTYLDSPATTSATTYTVYVRVSSSTAYIGSIASGANTISTITLMEIAA